MPFAISCCDPNSITTLWQIYLLKSKAVEFVRTQCLSPTNDTRYVVLKTGHSVPAWGTPDMTLDNSCHLVQM